ncbi:MAG: ABC transporter permease [Firmicutes bacterium]|nr:ABC transporter permease [Bacillota bacterium]
MKKKQYVNLIIGIVMIGTLALVAIFAPLIAPFAVDYADLDNPFQSPDNVHLFGTDAYGRDVFSRIVYGSRIAFRVAALSVFIELVLGVTVGLLAGYFGGWVDRILCFIMDVTMAIPSLVAAFAIISIIGKSLDNAIIAISLVGWAGLARIVRTKTMSIKNMAFLETGIAFGESVPALLFRYILPNIVPSLVVILSMAIPGSIMSTTGLSLLGLGATPPSPDWGLAISESMSRFLQAPLPALFTGMALVYTTFGFTMLGEGLRDIIDPRMKVN